MSITVNGIEYKVGIITPALVSPVHQVIGLTDFDSCEIQITTGLNPKREQQVFFHELMHIMLRNEDSFHEIEPVVARSSETLFGALADNGLLREGWMEGLIDYREETIEESKRVIVDHDPEQPDEPLRHGNHAEALPASGRDQLERRSQSSSK